MKKIQIITILFTILLSCTCEDSTNNTTIEIINLNNKIKNKLELSKICSDVKYVKLQTGRDYIIGRVDKLLTYQERFYILDKISKSIFVFDITGQFKFKISKIGKGPGEYTAIEDFTVNSYNKSIDIYEKGKQNIYVYGLNGTLEEILNLGIRLKYFMAIDKNKYLIFTNKLTKPGDKKEYANNILVINRRGRVLTKKFPYSLTSYSRTLFNEQTLMKYNNIAYINLLFHDTIYTVENNKISPSYYLNYGINRLPDEYRTIDNAEDLIKLFSSNYSLFNNILCETKHLVFLTFLQGNKQHYAIYSKHTHNTDVYATVNNDINNLPFSKTFMPTSETFRPLKRSIPIINSYNNKKMYGFLYPNEIDIKKLNELFPGTSIYDNPIILIYKLKTTVYETEY